jgi:membrane protein DedA with SNARE-associated domain
VGVFFAAGLVATAFAPALLVHAPLVLIGASPLLRHLALASPSVELVPFVAVAMAGLFATDPLLYVVGRDYGPEALTWVEERSSGARRLVGVLRRAFARAGLLVVFAFPGPIVCLLAGTARVPMRTFAAVNLLGTLVTVLLVRSIGVAFADQIEHVREFVGAHLVPLTLVSVVLVAASVALRRRRRALRARAARAPSRALGGRRP